MKKIGIQGGVRLQGKVRIQGSKNGALPVLAATLLTEGESRLFNCPRIGDVYQMLCLLEALGCRTSWEENGLRIRTEDVCCQNLPPQAVTGMRSSLFLMGPLLGRCKKVIMEHPGGCVIGRRPIDFHLDALRQMGAVFWEQQGKIAGTAPYGLHGAEITFRSPSVGATENVVLAAVTAKGTTVIHGAAKEPEVEHLCRYLACCGAKMTGIGTETIRIEGGAVLHGCEYRVPSDRIVAGTYLLACVGAGGNVFLEEAPTEHMKAVVQLARQMGAECQEDQKGLYIQMFRTPVLPKSLVTRPYPGFPTDLQSVFLAAACAGEGICLVEETIFENRFRIVEDLIQMGAVMQQIDSSMVLVRGPVRLYGGRNQAKELRGGAALITAGLMAEGETTIEGCGFIERGYENICRDFKELGARIYSV